MNLCSHNSLSACINILTIYRFCPILDNISRLRRWASQPTHPISSYIHFVPPLAHNALLKREALNAAPKKKLGLAPQLGTDHFAPSHGNSPMLCASGL